MFPQNWCGLQGIYGGYVLAQIVEAADAATDFGLLSVSVQFMGALQAGTADWEVSVQHAGRTTSTVAIEIHQPHLKVAATAKSGQGSAVRILDTTIDTGMFPKPETLERFNYVAGEMKYESFLDHRLFSVSDERSPSQSHAWIRFDEATLEASELGPLGLAAIFLDAQPPGLFFLPEPPKFVPTVDFTLHFAPHLPMDRHGWFYLTQATVWASREFAVEESRLFTQSGVFVAQLRQSRRVVWE